MIHPRLTALSVEAALKYLVREAEGLEDIRGLAWQRPFLAGGCALSALERLLLWLGVYPSPLLAFIQGALSVLR